MKVSLIMFAMLSCGMLASEAGAAESRKDGNSSMVAADLGKAAGGPALGRDARTRAGRAGAPIQAPGVTQAPRSNADRLHSLLIAQAHGHLARQFSPSVGATGAGAGGPRIRGPVSVRPPGQSKLAASTRSALPAPMHSTLGGSRVQGSAQVDGRAFSRTAHGAINDSSKFHRKF